MVITKVLDRHHAGRRSTCRTSPRGSAVAAWQLTVGQHHHAAGGRRRHRAKLGARRFPRRASRCSSCPHRRLRRISRRSRWPPRHPLRHRAAECAFSGSGSSDPDGTIASYAWTFGDGATGTGVVVNHTYATAGTLRRTAPGHRQQGRDPYGIADDHRERASGSAGGAGQSHGSGNRRGVVTLGWTDNANDETGFYVERAAKAEDAAILADRYCRRQRPDVFARRNVGAMGVSGPGVQRDRRVGLLQQRDRFECADGLSRVCRGKPRPRSAMLIGHR